MRQNVHKHHPKKRMQNKQTQVYPPLHDQTIVLFISNLSTNLLLPCSPDHPAVWGRWRQLVWECRTDAIKFFFPPADFDPSPAPAMLSCTSLDTTAAGSSRLPPGERLSPAPSAVRQKPVVDGVIVAAPKSSSEHEDGDIGSSRRKQRARGQGGDSSLRPKSLDDGGKRPLGDERGGTEGKAATAAAPGDERRGRRTGQPDSDGGRDRLSKNDAVTTGMSLLRPYVIDLKEEVSLRARRVYFPAV